MTNTTLAELQTAAGAVWDEGDPSVTGGKTILHFGDPAAEYEAGRTGAALLDLETRTFIDIVGNDRVTFLHSFCTNDVKVLEPGQGCEAFVTNVNAKTLGHIFIAAEPDSLSALSLNPSSEVLLEHWQRYLIGSDVKLRDRSKEFRCFLVTGPASASPLAAVDPEAATMPACSQRQIEFAGGPVRVRCVDWLHATAYVIVTPQSQAARVWKSCVEAGAVPAGRDTFHRLRIEAVFPLDGVDLTGDCLTQELGRTRQAISFTKGCYLGQEPIARIDAMGHVNRELRGLRLATDEMAVAGATVRSADGETEIGTVTSSARADQKHTLALAYLQRNWLQPGIEVRVQVAGAWKMATVFQAE